VREYGRIVGGEGWQEKVHDREEWKKLLRTARNCRILIPIASSQHNLHDIYHCCVYSAKLLMMDRGTVRNM